MTPTPLPAESAIDLASPSAFGSSARLPPSASVALDAAVDAALPPTGAGVVDANGEFGTVVSYQGLTATGGGLAEMVVVRHREQQVVLPASLFQAVDNGAGSRAYRIPLSFAAITHGSALDGRIVIPVLQEEMTVGTRLVDSGRGVRVHKQVIETPHLVERELLQDRLEVDTIAIGRLLEDDELPQIRQEGDVVIVPVIEEVLVVQTRRRLKEEMRIVRTSALHTRQQTVLLKSEQVSVERFDEAGAVTHPAGDSGAAAHVPGMHPPASVTAGQADQPASPGATQRDVSAGTRLPPATAPTSFNS